MSVKNIAFLIVQFFVNGPGDYLEKPYYLLTKVKVSKLITLCATESIFLRTFPFSQSTKLFRNSKEMESKLDKIL